MISIIDYQMGNPLSIKNMLSYLEIDSLITRDPEVIKKSDRLILPGVGSFDEAMKNLKELKLRDLLDELVLEQKIPILGICLGMQLLTNSSEEGRVNYVKSILISSGFNEPKIVRKYTSHSNSFLPFFNRDPFYSIIAEKSSK